MNALKVSIHFSPTEDYPVGILSDIRQRSVFQYDPGFLARGLPISPFRLPLQPQPLVYDGMGGLETFGVFEDALPDGWGRRIIDRHFRNRYGRLPTLLERLACVGAGGMGALAFAPAETFPSGVTPFNLSTLAENAWAFDGDLIGDVLPELRRLAGSSGGARPKAYIGYSPRTKRVCAEAETLPAGYEHWIVKFNTRADGPLAGEREYEYARLARLAGATVQSYQLIETRAGRFFATRRFDRLPHGERLHLHSAAGLLHADFRIPGEEYETLFKLADALTHDYETKRELFRRACLNVILHNRDDHLKNFAFLMSSRGAWSLAPFYDFTRSDGASGWQTLSVAGEGRNPGDADLRRLATRVGLNAPDAEKILDRVHSAAAALPKRIFRGKD